MTCEGDKGRLGFEVQYIFLSPKESKRGEREIPATLTCGASSPMESGEAEMMPRFLDWKYGTCSRHRQLMRIGFRLEGVGH